jgi:hypothetical protein
MAMSMVPFYRPCLQEVDFCMGSFFFNQFLIAYVQTQTVMIISIFLSIIIRSSKTTINTVFMILALSGMLLDIPRFYIYEPYDI